MLDCWGIVILTYSDYYMYALRYRKLKGCWVRRNPAWGIWRGALLKEEAMTFAEVTTQALKESGGIASVEEIQRRCTEMGFRKRNGSQIDSKYVAWGVACYPDQFEMSVILRK